MIMKNKVKIMINEILENISSKIDLIFDAGIEEDVKGFFRNDKTVKEYHLSEMPNKKYRLDIALTESTDIEKKRIFYSFMRFMNYSEMTLYKENKSNCIEGYFYLTVAKDMKGFYFEIYFKDKEEFENYKWDRLIL